MTSARSGPSVLAESAEVVASRRSGRHTHLTLVSPGIAERARVGQFVMVSIGALATADPRRRPYWLHAAHTGEQYGGTLEVVIDPVSASARWLAGRAPGERVDLLGPLGRPTPLPSEAMACLLVGSRTAQATLAWLATVLRARGCHVSGLLVAHEGREVLAAVETRRACDRVVVVAVPSGGDPSNAPHERPVVDAAHSLCPSPDLVYVAGSAADALVAEAISHQTGATAVVVLEHPLPCGTGLCQGCRVAGRDPDAAGPRVCLDGPSLAFETVDWQACVAHGQVQHRVGYLP